MGPLDVNLISVVVLNWNGYRVIDQCLNSLSPKPIGP